MGPLGPGGKDTGEASARMILGGFFYQFQMSGKTAYSEILEIIGYDPVNKNFSSDCYFDDGSRFSGVITIAGNTWTWVGKLVTAGKQYQYKETFEFAPDLASATSKGGISADGQTWTSLFESKFTKVKSAPKK